MPEVFSELAHTRTTAAASLLNPAARQERLDVPARCRARRWLPFAAAILTCRAASAEPITIERALDLARQHNPEIVAARQDLEVARGRLIKARYLNPFNPEVSGQGNHREFAAGGGATDYGVTLSQEVEVAGQRNRRIAEAERNAERIEATVRDRERLFDLAVRKAFFAALAADQRLTLLRTVEDLNRRVRDASRARERAGEAPPMEANLAEIRFGQSRKETMAADASRLAALSEVRRLLAVPQQRAIEPSGELRPTAPAIDLTAALDQALARRPDLHAALAEVRRSEAETALTRRLRVPNPTVEAFYTTDSEAGSPGADTIAGAGLRIPLPVFDRKQGELVALAAQEVQARSLAEGARQTVEKQVAEAVARYEAARRTVAVFDADVLGRVEETFRFIEVGYRAGKLDLLQFIVVQNDLVSAQLSYLDSVTELRDAMVHLEAVTGGAP